MASSEAAPARRFDHVGVVVADLEAAKRFAIAALGFELVREATLPELGLRLAFVGAGDLVVELIEPTDPAQRAARLGHAQARIEHLAWETDDVAATAAALAEHGVRLRGGIGADAPPEPLRLGPARNLFSVPASSAGLLLQFFDRR